MDRRSFIRAAGIAAAGTAVTLAAPAVAQRRTDLRLVMPWTRDFPGLGTSAQRIADRIGDLTDGRLSVTVFAAGELVPPLDEFAAVGDGRADLYHAPDYYYASHHPALAFFTNVPLGMTATEHATWITAGIGQPYWDDLSAQFEIKPLLVGNTGAQMGGWFKQPIVSVADLAGRRFRMPGLGGELWSALGMNVVTMPAAQILPSLSDGSLDGADWIGPWNDTELGIQHVAGNYYYPSLVEGSGAITLGINRRLWFGLSGTDREIIEAAARAEQVMFRAEYLFRNSLALRDLRADTSVRILPFPDDVLAAVARAAPDIAASVAIDRIGRTIHDTYFQTLAVMRDWNEISDGAYIAARTAQLAGR